MHVILFLDELALRAEGVKYEQFRREWIAPYFWSENYIQAYANEVVFVPKMDSRMKLDLKENERLVTAPKLKTKKGRNRTQRLTTGTGGRRSREIWWGTQDTERTNTLNSRKRRCSKTV